MNGRRAIRGTRGGFLIVVLASAVSGCAGRNHGAEGGRWLSRAYEQTYYLASHNWAFRHRYSRADRLFNAFDYGHAALSEILFTQPAAPNETLDRDQLRFITGRVLRRPPAVPLEERAIAPAFSRLVPEVELTFEWAHMLHRQLYDVWADERIPETAKDRAIAEVVQYYESRRDLALSAKPKSMAPMESRIYSGAFRSRYPRFNGLIWSYHWLQLALYDALMSEPSATGRRAAVNRTVDRFDWMTACPADRLPRAMPMAAAVAPRFAERYPEAAAIFDNLHALHDVVSDILASPRVPQDEKRAAMLAALAEYRDPQRDATTFDDWRAMARNMGVDAMGGVGPAPPGASTPPAPCDRP
jgi:hypothetical protein